MSRPRVVPLATYRLQLGPHLDLRGAAGLVPYLASLGISHLYLSPIFKARAGSTHGYDVVDHDTVDPQLGGEEALRHLSARAKEHGLGLVIDVVPNHMCIASAENAWWMDVLENGPGSPYARYFDIDWKPPKPDLEDKVLLPVLGEQFGRVLESGELRLERTAGTFTIAYWDWRFPAAPRSWSQVLAPALETVVAQVGPEHADAVELASILTAISYLPSRSETEERRVRERRREKEVVRRRLAALLASSGLVAEAVDASVADMNGRPGEPHSFDRLEALLEDQPYRLSHWRVASDEINYRRFFDINELAALRVEVPEVFDAVHRLPFALFEEGLVDGLRLDHVDGLYDPLAYLARLPAGCFVVVEKILGEGERLRPEWPVDGTTGYEQLARLDAVFVDGSARNTLLELQEQLTGEDAAWPEVAYESKMLVLDVAMSGELTMLASRLDRISEQYRFSRDFTLNTLQQALAEVIACWPVYRTYVTADGTVGPEDRRHIQAALREARRRNPALSASLFDFLGSVLLLDHPPQLEESQRAARLEFVLRFQQITGPVTAKGVEDTAFYRYGTLLCANEVGGRPEALGMSVERFHLENVERARTTPLSLSATATHDTKRGEDLRTRLGLVSEDPDGWVETVARWRGRNASHHVTLDGGSAPDGFDQNLIYQTLVGMWRPGIAGGERAEDVRRVQAYLVKAAREAKRRTSWISPDADYERQLAAFAETVLGDAAFVDELEAFVEPLRVRAGWATAARVLLKVTGPGIPDFYQGTELTDCSLVDPDNRRPVDFTLRQETLDRLQREHAADPVALARRLLELPDGDELKLLVAWRSLQLRRSARVVFEEGDYLPVEVQGPHAGHVLAFERRHGRQVVLVAVSRLHGRLAVPPIGGAWGGTCLRLEDRGARAWRDAITGRTVGATAGGLLLDDVFAALPLAALELQP